jgi:hypothetical protein
MANLQLSPLLARFLGVTLIVTPRALLVWAGRFALAPSEEAASAALKPMAPSVTID